ncbi:MAG: hypothetical protein R3E65_08205 [Steroidobacteraceae bacterium]
MNRTSAWLLAVMVMSGPASAETSADAVAERMLDALGGRAAWAALKTLVNDSCQYRIEAPTVVRTVISLDLQRARFRIETWGPDLHLIRAVDGEAHWRLSRAGIIEPIPDATLSGDRRWYTGHVYRTIHRIAAKDPTISLGIGKDERLEVHESGARIAWFQLDARGEPYAFGGVEDEEGSVSGPWTYVGGGVRHPAWVARRDAAFRSVLLGLESPEILPDSVTDRPSSPAAVTAVPRALTACGVVLAPRT